MREFLSQKNHSLFCKFLVNITRLNSSPWSSLKLSKEENVLHVTFDWTLRRLFISLDKLRVLDLDFDNPGCNPHPSG